MHTQEENTVVNAQNILPKTIYWFSALDDAFSRERSRKLRVLVSFSGCVFGPSFVCALYEIRSKYALHSSVLKWTPWRMWIARHPIFRKTFSLMEFLAQIFRAVNHGRSCCVHLNHGEGEKREQQCVWQTQYFHFATSEPPNLFSPSIFSFIFLDENSIRNIFTRRLILNAFPSAYRGGLCFAAVD